MLRLALRGVAAHPRRAVACSFAVFLGGALATGSLVLTGSIDRSLASRTDEALAGVAVTDSPKQIIDAKGEIPPPLPAALVDALRAVEGAEAVAGQVFSPTRVVDAQGRAVGAVLAPDLLTSTLPPRLRGRSHQAGRAPRTVSEAALDTTSARRAGVGLGDRLRVAGRGTARSYRVVGLVPLAIRPMSAARRSCSHRPRRLG